MDKKKTDIISVLAIMALFVLFYSLFLKDDLSAYRSLRHKRASLEEAINRDKYTLVTEKKRVIDVLNLEKEIKGDKLFLLKEDRVPYFLNHISSLALRYKVEILSIEPGETIDVDLLTRTTFTAQLKGGFPHIYNFLYHLEEDWRSVKVETLTIDKNSEDNSVTVKLVLAVLSIEGYKETA